MFYERLTGLCEQRGEKLTPLVKQMGMSTGNIKRWKDGVVPNGETISRFAEHFNVSSDYLLGHSSDPAPIEDEKKASPEEIEAELRRILKRIPDKEFTPEKADKLIKIFKDVIDSAVD